MRWQWPLGLAAAAIGATVLAGCATGRLGIAPLERPTDPAPLLSSLESYNRGPEAVRIGGTIRAEGKGKADFGATVADGVGLRFDAVAGPFSTPLLALACVAGSECRAYVPSRQRVYVDRWADWAELLGTLIRGRVPLLARVDGAWHTARGNPALLLRADGGWVERVDLDPEGRLPVQAILGKEGEEPLVTIGYADFTTELTGLPFPRQIRLWMERQATAYEIMVRRIEPTQQPDARVFTLAVPPGTEEEQARGNTAWKENDIPLWLAFPNGTASSRP